MAAVSGRLPVSQSVPLRHCASSSLPLVVIYSGWLPPAPTSASPTILSSALLSVDHLVTVVTLRRRSSPTTSRHPIPPSEQGSSGCSSPSHALRRFPLLLPHTKCLIKDRRRSTAAGHACPQDTRSSGSRLLGQSPPAACTCASWRRRESACISEPRCTLSTLPSSRPRVRLKCQGTCIMCRAEGVGCLHSRSPQSGTVQRPQLSVDQLQKRRAGRPLICLR